MKKKNYFRKMWNLGLMSTFFALLLLGFAAKAQNPNILFKETFSKVSSTTAIGFSTHTNTTIKLDSLNKLTDNPGWFTDTIVANTSSKGQLAYVAFLKTDTIRALRLNSNDPIKSREDSTSFLESPWINVSAVKGSTFNLTFDAMAPIAGNSSRLNVYMITKNGGKTLVTQIRDLPNVIGQTKAYNLLNISAPAGTDSIKIRFANGMYKDSVYNSEGKLVKENLIRDTNDAVTPKTRVNGGFVITNIIVSKGDVNADLSSLTIGGLSVANFNAKTLFYYEKVAAGTVTVPVLGYTVSSTSTNPEPAVEVFNDTVFPGLSTVKVTSPNGVITRTYSVDIRKLAPVNDGSFEKPLTATEAVSYIGDTVWVKGYIRGVCNTKGVLYPTSAYSGNIVLDTVYDKAKKDSTSYFYAKIATLSTSKNFQDTMTYNALNNKPKNEGRVILVRGVVNDRPVDVINAGFGDKILDYAFLDDASLSSLKFAGTEWRRFAQDSLDDPNSKKTAQYVSYGYTTSQVFPAITYTTSYYKATSTIIPSTGKPAAWTDTVKINVTAGDGKTKRTYFISFRPISSDTTLKSLSVSSTTAPAQNYTFTPTFNSATKTYELAERVRWKNADKITLTHAATNYYADIAATTVKNAKKTGITVDLDTSIVATVTAENGAKGSYTVNFTVAAPYTDTRFDSISVSESVSTTAKYVVFRDLTINDTIEMELPYSYAKGYIRVGAADVGYATAAPSSQYISGNSTTDMKVDSTYLRFCVVTAEDGTTKDTVWLKATRLKNEDASLDTILVNPGVLFPSFSKDQLTGYSVSLSNDQDSITISARTTDPLATIVSGTGKFYVGTGSTFFTIRTKAQLEDSTREYVIEVIRAKNEDATLSNITLSAGELNPAFDPTVTGYEVLVPYAVNRITVTGIATNDNAKVENPKEDTLLAVGVTTLDIVVTAEDGTTSIIYTVEVVRGDPNDIATLDSIGVNGVLISGFDKATTEYTYVYGHDVITVPTVTAKTTDSLATLVITDAASLAGATTIAVTAQDPEVHKTYTISFREISANATLDTIKVDGVALSGFESNILSYTYEIPYNSTVVPVVTATAKSEFAQTPVIVAAATVNDTTTITVTAEDNLAQTIYKVAFKQAAPNVDASLKSLSVAGTTLDPAFASDKYSYAVTMSKDSSYITISAVPTFEGATVTGTGRLTFTTDSSTFVVTVTAQDGTTKQNYTISAKKLGIAGLEAEDVKISLYPNPATDVVTLKLSGVTGEAQVAIYNTVGTLVLTKQVQGEKVLNIENLTKGTYFVKVTTKQGTFVEKLIKL